MNQIEQGNREERENPLKNQSEAVEQKKIDTARRLLTPV